MKTRSLSSVITGSLITLSLLLSIASCGSNPKEAGQKKSTDKAVTTGIKAKKIKNIIVVTDVNEMSGDSIVIDRRTTLLKSVYSAFENVIKSNFYIKSKDKLFVKFVGNNPEMEAIDRNSEKLYINMKSTIIANKKAKETERRVAFDSSLNEINSILFKQTKTKYSNVNSIHRFLQEDFEKELLAGDSVLNFLIIISNGISHGSDQWVDSTKKFANVNVLFVEMEPQDKDGAWDNLTSMWKNRLSRFDLTSVSFEKRASMTREQLAVNSFLQVTAIGASVPVAPAVDTTKIDTTKNNSIKKAPVNNPVVTEPSTRKNDTIKKESSSIGDNVKNKLVTDSDTVKKSPLVVKPVESKIGKTTIKPDTVASTKQVVTKSVPKSTVKTINFSDGSKYIGETVNEQPHGKGNFYYAAPRSFVKDRPDLGEASAGDSIIDGYWNSGNLNHGKYFHNGAQKSKIIGNY